MRKFKTFLRLSSILDIIIVRHVPCTLILGYVKHVLEQWARKLHCTTTTFLCIDELELSKELRCRQSAFVRDEVVHVRHMRVVSRELDVWCGQIASHSTLLSLTNPWQASQKSRMKFSEWFYGWQKDRLRTLFSLKIPKHHGRESSSSCRKAHTSRKRKRKKTIRAKFFQCQLFFFMLLSLSIRFPALIYWYFYDVEFAISSLIIMLATSRKKSTSERHMLIFFSSFF